MCGRFSLTVSQNELNEAFYDIASDAPQISPRYNICPTQQVLSIVVGESKQVEWRFLRWGLVPAWTKNIDSKTPLINARAETISQKPTFKPLFSRRRCLVVADGFYEWQKLSSCNVKQPWYFRLLPNQSTSQTPNQLHAPNQCIPTPCVFAFAALWDTWQSPDGTKVDSCVILTTKPNSLVQPIHDRMPLIIKPCDYRTWLLATPLPPSECERLFNPYPAEYMLAWKVSRTIGNPKLEGPQCIAPVQELDLEYQ